ncbi:MAG: response regulator transcription factor [Nitrospirota bacterium]|nr:response regulator transcription factor [Nitrospirota bacterium]
MIDLVIADDHAIFRYGLRALLSDEPDFRILSEADNGTAALGEIREKNPQIAVLDVSMPGKNGVEVLAEVCRDKLKTRCILLTVHNNPVLAATAIRNGAAGYLLKNQTFRELPDALRVVAAGKKYYSAELIQALARQKEHLNLARQLTRREYEVLALIVKGMTNNEIATQLKISIRTAETHKSRIMNKLDIHTSVALIAYAFQHKLVNDSQDMPSSE